MWGVGFYRFSGGQLPNFQGKSQDKNKKSGGNPYANQATYLGENYLKLVFNKYYQGQYDIERVADYLRARHPRPYLEVAASSQWSIVELKPNPGQEITRRSDLFVYRTMDLGVADTLFRRLPFYSDRFSSHGERFCYLMLDGKGASMEGFEDKSQIEDALDAALTQQGLGAVMGSGTGLRYSYIDLALSNLDNASDTIIQVLRQGGIVTNAWLLFHDDEWHDEWIGIHDDTPAPPPA